MWWPLLLGGGAVAAVALLCALFYLVVHCTARHPGVPTVTPGPIGFPLGSLGAWDDLLQVNREIRASGKAMVAQWTFYRQSVRIMERCNCCC